MPFPKVIVIFNKTDWSTFTRRGQVKAIAALTERFGTKVISVNRPLCPFSTIYRKPSRLKELVTSSNLEPLSTNLYLASPRYWLSDMVAWRLPLVERANIRALQGWYRDLARKLDLGSDPPWVWYYHPVQSYVSRVFPQSPIIYEMYDLLADVADNPDAAGRYLESLQRESVDAMLAVSPKLLHDWGRNYRAALLSGNGLPEKTFEQLASGMASVNPGVELIPHPRLGYAGNISERLDWELLRPLVHENPQWQFVFVGRQSGDILKEKLGTAKNVHYLGQVSQDQIAGIIAGFDIGILPYLSTNFIDCSNPLKFYEHAASGLPTVSCPNDLLSQFPSDLVRTVGPDVAHWKSTIIEMLALDRDDLRRRYRDFSAQYTWEAISARVIEALAEKLA